MLKRITALALVLALVLSMTTAFAWSCPSCGAEMEGKFCSECGTKKPENICPSCGTNHGDKELNFCTECGAKMGTAAEPAATPEPTAAPTEEPKAAGPEILSLTDNGEGSATILWLGEVGETYKIRYFLKQSDDMEADLNAANSIGSYFHESDMIAYTLTRLVPGESYWIGVEDKDGNSTYQAYVPNSQPGPFTDFPITVYALPTVRQNDEDIRVDYFQPSQIKSDSGVQCGLYLVMAYQNTVEEHQPRIQVAVEAPNGAKLVLFSSMHTFKVSDTEEYNGWSFFTLKEYVAIMERYFGAVPEGEHKVSIYLNGQLGGTVSFQVQEDAAELPAESTAATTAEAEATTMEWILAKDNGDGTVEVTWDESQAPYKIRYAEKRSDDYSADQKDPTSFGIWVAESEWEETSYTLKRLAPGREYWISVLDATGNGRCIAYEPGAAAELEGYSTSLEIIPRSQVGETDTNLSCIPAGKAGLEDDVAYGMYVCLNYSNPGEEQEVFLQLVLTLPNGAVHVEEYVETSMDTGENKAMGWTFYDLEWYWEQVLRNFDTIPVGDVKVECYLNGQLAASGVLPVREEKALKITDVTSNGDGTYLLTWEDNGNGPYEVIYWERFTDDMEADKNDDRGTARWRDKSNWDQTQWTMEYLIPGKRYWITVSDSLGGQGVTTCDVPAAEKLNMDVKIEGTLRKEENGEYIDMKGFSAATLNQDYTERYGLCIDVIYSYLPEDIQMQSNMVMTMPNGASICIESTDLTWYAECFHWNFYCLDWAFAQVKRLYGGMLEGEYRLDLYAEGNYAGSTTFYVGQ